MFSLGEDLLKQRWHDFCGYSGNPISSDLQVSKGLSPLGFLFQGPQTLGGGGLYTEQTQTSCYPKDTWVLRKLGLGLQTISTPWFRAA